MIAAEMRTLNLCACILPFILGAAVAQQTGSGSLDVDNDLAKVCRPLDRSLDLLFILDGSGSVSGNTFDTQMNMLHRIVDMVEIGKNKTRVAVLQYAGYTRMEFEFQDHLTKEELKEAIDNIKYLSGTTRTGKALRRAQAAFTPERGARMNDADVAQVAVVVSDGHSQDDPIPPAEQLRRSGVTVIALGIGEFVNMHELEDITADKALTFQNQTMDHFVDAFRKIAIGEKCDFAKGTNGAEILCESDAMKVNILTQKPFKGHLYVPGYFKVPGCSVQASRQDNQSTTLRLPLDNTCGVQRQISTNPRGLLFETEVILKYHPEYNTKADRSFTVRCFYPDLRFFHTVQIQNSTVEFKTSQDESNPINELESSVETGRLPVPDMVMPCSYTIKPQSGTGCKLEDSNVGDSVLHVWECDSRALSPYGMLVHSCYITNSQGQQELIMDEQGCSLDKHLIGELSYEGNLKVSSRGTVVKYSDNPVVRYRCSLRFCNRKKGECEEILPPKCGNSTTTTTNRTKRQLGPGEGLAVPIPTDFAEVPPQVVQRLFLRRNGFARANQSANTVGQRVRSGVPPSASIPFPPLPPPLDALPPFAPPPPVPSGLESQTVAPVQRIIPQQFNGRKFRISPPEIIRSTTETTNQPTTSTSTQKLTTTEEQKTTPEASTSTGTRVPSTSTSTTSASTSAEASTSIASSSTSTTSASTSTEASTEAASTSTETSNVTVSSGNSSTSQPLNVDSQSETRQTVKVLPDLEEGSGESEEATTSVQRLSTSTHLLESTSTTGPALNFSASLEATNSTLLFPPPPPPPAFVPPPPPPPPQTAETVTSTSTESTSSSTTIASTSASAAATTTELHAPTTTEEPSDFELQGLAGIVKTRLDFKQIQLNSQILIVRDRPISATQPQPFLCQSKNF